VFNAAERNEEHFAEVIMCFFQRFPAFYNPKDPAGGTSSDFYLDLFAFLHQVQLSLRLEDLSSYRVLKVAVFIARFIHPGVQRFQRLLLPGSFSNVQEQPAALGH
jgi:hypothetical protein